MTRITIDAETRSRLVSSGDQVELCDEQGATVGYFMPPAEHRTWFYAWLRTQFDDEEIEKARREAGGLSISEALAYLQQLNSSKSSNAAPS